MSTPEERLRRGQDIEEAFHSGSIGELLSVCNRCRARVGKNFVEMGAHLDWHDWLDQVAAAAVANDPRRNREQTK